MLLRWSPLHCGCWSSFSTAKASRASSARSLRLSHELHRSWLPHPARVSQGGHDAACSAGFDVRQSLHLRCFRQSLFRQSELTSNQELAGVSKTGRAVSLPPCENRAGLGQPHVVTTL